MTPPDPTSHTDPLTQPWPAQALQAVKACPYCGDTARTLAYRGVQDWSFNTAPGRWDYWRCEHCQALYLSPRPDAASIGRAYGAYYTHGASASLGVLGGLKQRLRNEYWSHQLATSITPRLGWPRWSGACLRFFLKDRIAEPFGLRQLAQLPKGVLIDVGCGSGALLVRAAQLGWQARGIELDPMAVQAAQAQGLNVEQGSYEALSRYAGQADCLVCSHVIEHVHEPLKLLDLLLAALKPEGVLLLSAPNASSDLHAHYGENWRGLEAPRHLAIPDASWLTAYLQDRGMACTQWPSSDRVMPVESERIRRRAAAPQRADRRAAKKVAQKMPQSSMATQDIVQLVCTRGPR